MDKDRPMSLAVPVALLLIVIPYNLRRKDSAGILSACHHVTNDPR